MTPVIVCILWNQIFIGFVPELGKEFGIELMGTNLLSEKTTALYAVAFVDLWMLIPYAMLLFISALNAIPKELIEFAVLEGTNPKDYFFYVEFPHLLPSIGMLSTIILSYAFTHIDSLMTLTAGGPGRATETVYYTIYKNSTLEQHYSYGLAEGTVVASFSVLVFLLINKYISNKYIADISTYSE